MSCYSTEWQASQKVFVERHRTTSRYFQTCRGSPSREIHALMSTDLIKNFLPAVHARWQTVMMRSWGHNINYATKKNWQPLSLWGRGLNDGTRIIFTMTDHYNIWLRGIFFVTTKKSRPEGECVLLDMWTSWMMHHLPRPLF